MSIDYEQRQLQMKLNAQADAAKKAAALRVKEASKRGEAAKAQQAAQCTSSASTMKMKLREVERATEYANNYGKEASALETKAAQYGSEATKVQAKIARIAAEENERQARKLTIARRAAERERVKVTNQMAETEFRISATEATLRTLTAPKAEKLRILMLGASPGGDLRIGREHKRIVRAVRAALHRDQVEIEVRLSATTDDLQEGIARFRPHVVHFSGHGDEQIIAFERELDDFHEGVIVTANGFAAACEATDEPPKLVVLNACRSAGTADALAHRFAPAAIGMTGSIDDIDALDYAANFYSSIANGQSLRSAHAAGRAALELNGGEHELPHLSVATGVDPANVLLVQPPASAA